MPWFRVDDSFHGHPKVQRAGNAAIGLWVRCGSWSSQYLTDGHVTSEVARRYGRTGEIERLLTSAMWVQNGDGFLMPDFLEFNPSAEQVRAERAAARARQAKRRRDEAGKFE